MKQNIRAFAVAVALVAVGSSGALAQKRGFGENSTDIGPVVGLGGIGGTVSFGGRFERAVKRLPNLGDGVLAVQLSADYYSFSQRFTGVTDFNFRYIPIGATANYHIKVKDDKFDPFVGLGLGYAIVSTSYTGVGGSASALYFVGRAGLRYYMANGVALYGDVGAGAATLNAGVMFRMSGNK